MYMTAHIYTVPPKTARALSARQRHIRLILSQAALIALFTVQHMSLRAPLASPPLSKNATHPASTQASTKGGHTTAPTHTQTSQLHMRLPAAAPQDGRRQGPRWLMQGSPHQEPPRRLYHHPAKVSNPQAKPDRGLLLSSRASAGPVPRPPRAS